MPKQTYTQKFRKEWLQEGFCKDWIMEIPGDASNARCRFCNSVFRAKLYDIKEHSKSKKHLTNSEPFSSARQMKISLHKLDKSNTVARNEAQLALFIAEHCSMNTSDHLVDVVKKCFGDDKRGMEMSLHRTKCTAVIKHVMMPHFVSKLREDINGRKFSLLLDESTDISVTKYLGIVICYYSESGKNIVSTFLQLAPLTECNASAIVDVLKKTLDEHGLDLHNLIGIGTDNASVMVGINNGVYQKLKEEIPSLVLVRCVCHSLQLAVSQASSRTLPRNLEFLVSETYNWFARSSSRQQAYKDLYQLINDGHNPHKIVQACQTRWMSIASAVKVICDQWLELKTHFEIARRSESCYASEMLYEMYCDDFNYVYLLFLKSILTETERVNKNFEANDSDPTKLLEDLTFLIKTLVNRVVLPTQAHRIDPFTCNLEEYLIPRINLGYEAEKKLQESSITPEQEKNLRNRSSEFLIELIKQLRQRVPDNIKVLKTMSVLSVSQTLRVVKDSICPLLESMNFSSEIIAKADMQWSNITLIKWSETKDTVKFWVEVLEYKDAANAVPFLELATCALTILSLPHSNAEVERIFSQMNLVKNKLRNKMNTDTVNAILHIRYGLKRMGKTCSTYEFPNDVLDYVKGNAKYLTRTASPDQPSTSSPHHPIASSAGYVMADKDAELQDIFIEEL